MMNNYVKTSFSLPKTTLFELNKNLTANISRQYIVSACIRKYIRKYNRLTFSQRGTCLYNREMPCDQKIKIWLSVKEHDTLKTMRFMLNLSVSFMIYQAINLYLKSIIRLYEHSLHSKKNRRVKYNRIKNIMDNFLKHIHRNISFRSKNLIGLRIVIPLPSKLQSKKLQKQDFFWEKYRK